MPASKRAPSRAAESEPDPKRVETDQTNEAEDENNPPEDSEDDEEAIKALENEFEPHEYVCLFTPPYGREGGEDEESDEEDDNEDLHKKPASEHPEHKFVIQWDGFKKYHDYCRYATYVDPDSFDMHIHSDYLSYGIIQLIENLLHDFDTALKAKNTNLMWSNIACLGHFLNHTLADQWPLADDGERVEKLCGIIGCAILSALNVLDQEGQVKSDSEFKDLGLVMALYIRQGEVSGPDMDHSYEETIVQYAKKAGINLKESGIKGLEDRLKDFENSGALEGEAKANRWDWTKKYKSYIERHRGEPKGKFTHNILTMSRDQRANYAFDKKDPLAQFSAKDLKEGNIMLK